MNDLLAQKLKDLPDSPGVYLMKNAAGQIIYVGKAKVLKNRVRQYFHSGWKGEKTALMVSHIEDLEYVLTHSETDALVLESNLIKKHKPPYNILLKDDKNFPYLRVDLHEPYPAFTVVRKLKKDGARYFGPFLGISVKELLEMLYAAFPLRTCRFNFSAGKKAARPCLNYHLGRCLGPCCFEVPPERYLGEVRRAMRFLEGNDEEIGKIFRERMAAAARNQDFEAAILYRDRLSALEKLGQRKVAALERKVSLDVFAYLSNGVYGVVSALLVREGKIVGARSFPFPEVSLQKSDSLANFLMQYYEDSLPPPEILVDLDLPEAPALEEHFSDLAGRKVKISRPARGKKKSLLDMAGKNTADYLTKTVEKYRHHEEMTAGAVAMLQEILGLDRLPRRMECYDISNISGTDKTASMVVFFDGEPDKAAYRRFRIKTVEGSDDFASLHEVLSRRIRRAEEGEDPSFSVLPDLFVIDGGKGQLSSAYDAMRKFGVDRPMISLAKREEEIWTVGADQPIRLPKSNLALRMLQRIRDEAHRFAITFHRALRNRHLTSELEQIEGIGPAKRKALLQRFHSREEIREATREELMQTPGISGKLADVILAWFRRSPTADPRLPDPKREGLERTDGADGEDPGIFPERSGEEGVQDAPGRREEDLGQ